MTATATPNTDGIPKALAMRTDEGSAIIATIKPIQ
jgi:hypothetical protein